jgi:enoyl-CoA hydratase/carnithine racemase
MPFYVPTADETWFTAEEAKAAGFIDAVDNAAAAPANKWNLAAFDKAPKALIEKTAPKNSAPLSTAAADYLAAELAECTASLARAQAFVVANPDDPIRCFAEDEIEDEAGCIALITTYQAAGTESAPAASADDAAMSALRAHTERRFRLLETSSI